MGEEADAALPPSEMSARLRNRSVGGYLPSLPAAAADCIDAQAAEITALRAAKDYMVDQAISLRAERDALAARLAVPGDDYLDELVRGLSRVGIFEPLGSNGAQAARALTALRARVAGLEGAQVVTDEMVEQGAKGIWERNTSRDYPWDTHKNRPAHMLVVHQYRKDARAALTAALSPSAAQEVSDAE